MKKKVRKDFDLLKDKGYLCTLVVQYKL